MSLSFCALLRRCASVNLDLNIPTLVWDSRARKTDMPQLALISRRLALNQYLRFACRDDSEKADLGLIYLFLALGCPLPEALARQHALACSLPDTKSRLDAADFLAVYSEIIRDRTQDFCVSCGQFKYRSDLDAAYKCCSYCSIAS